MLAAIAGFLPGYLRQHRLPNQITIPIRPRGWTRSISKVADTADGADDVMGSVPHGRSQPALGRRPRTCRTAPQRPSRLAAYNLDTRKDQLTLAADVIFLY